MADPHAGQRQVVQLPTELVWRYRETDRWTMPRGEKGRIRVLLGDITSNGIRVPLRLRFDASSAWVCNGNHRLACARAAGMPFVPVSLEPVLHGIPHIDNGGDTLLPEHLQLIVDLCHEACTDSVRSSL